MSLNSLTTLLWRERELLDLLEFKMEEQQLLLLAGKSQWVDRAAQEIETVLEKVQTASLARAVESATVATELRLDADAALAQIVAAVKDPAWRDVLEGHLTALRGSTSRIAALRETNTQYLRTAQRAAQETLANLDAETYSGTGGRSSDRAGRSSGLLDTEA